MVPVTVRAAVWWPIREPLLEQLKEATLLTLEMVTKLAWPS
jgi:hypothetical protein